VIRIVVVETGSVQPGWCNEWRERGFVVLRGAIDPAPITAEVDRALLDVFLGDTTAAVAQRSETSTFQYVPMMCERTPVSLGLLDQCSEMAAELFGRAVLPGRAKGIRYFGDTAWHRDNPDDDAPPSVVFVAYLDSVDASNGALRVQVGSHVDRDPSRPGASPGDATSATVDTEPGDIIAFDEHLLHGSTGGVERRQWRVLPAKGRKHSESFELKRYCYRCQALLGGVLPKSFKSEPTIQFL